MIERIWCRECNKVLKEADAAELNNAPMPTYCGFCGKAAMTRTSGISAEELKDITFDISIINKTTGMNTHTSFIINAQKQGDPENSGIYFIDKLTDALAIIMSPKIIKEMMRR